MKSELDFLVATNPLILRCYMAVSPYGEPVVGSISKTRKGAEMRCRTIFKKLWKTLEKRGYRVVEVRVNELREFNTAQSLPVGEGK